MCASFEADGHVTKCIVGHMDCLHLLYEIGSYHQMGEEN